MKTDLVIRRPAKDGVIAQLDKARTALAQARTIQQTKQIADAARAAKIYAQRQHMGDDLIGYAHAVQIEALAKLGGMLMETPKNEGKLKRGPVVPVGNRGEPATLAELGLSKKTSMMAQRLASLPVEIQTEIAERVKTLTEALRLQRRANAKAAPPLPDKIYSTFLADPPWWYGDSRLKLKGATGASAHYESMTIEQLCLLAIKGLAAKNAVLFLWVTSPLLAECWPVIEAWGFKYKASFVWDKQKHNFGHYNSARHEFLLVCTRGSYVPDPDIAAKIDSVQSIERGKHSEKPEKFYEIIETLYPHGRRLELFARKRRPGWDAWGDQV